MISHFYHHVETHTHVLNHTGLDRKTKKLNTHMGVLSHTHVCILTGIGPNGPSVISHMMMIREGFNKSSETN